MDNLNVSGVYKVLCLVNGKFYIGSSKNIQARWYTHRAPSAWRKYPNRALYQDMQKYGVENFRLQILCPVMEEYLKQVEQELIEMLKPTYNDHNAYGDNVERYKETKRKHGKKYRQERKDYIKKYHDEYFYQLCSYNGETLTLKALLRRFQRMKIPHATMEAKKYLINTTQM